MVLSGGNPALLQLGELVEQLQAAGQQVAVETQGSMWRDWLATGRPPRRLAKAAFLWDGHCRERGAVRPLRRAPGKQGAPTPS